jgi:signal transduction histidine kinase
VGVLGLALAIQPSKNAGATQATVSLQFQPECANLLVRDDGPGFDGESVPPASHGLGFARERAEASWAMLTIDGKIGQGIEIAAR